MSTQVLGDVELVTKQEVEAMLDAVVVPEDDINEKITAAATILENAIQSAKTELHSEVQIVQASVADEATARAAADATLDDKIADEAQLRETTDDALRSRIEREEGVREAADHELSELIAHETAERKEADEQIEENIKEHLNIKESDAFEDTIFCSRLTNLPIAQATIDVHDHTLEVGDIVATVSARYLPNIPVTFSLVAELTNAGVTGYYYISARMDANGNVIVINKSELSGTYVGNVNSATVMYITKE